MYKITIINYQQIVKPPTNKIVFFLYIIISILQLQYLLYNLI